MAEPKRRALIAWSSGKDSAYALHEVRRSGDYEIVGALTTVTDTFSRVSMHGVREVLLQRQLAAARLASIVVRIPFPCSNEIYEREMSQAMAAARARGVTHVIFGDLFLEEIRAYRETRLAEIGIEAVFPLWRRPTDRLAREMIASGLCARLSTVDLARLPPSFSGRRFDETLLADLPAAVDPCGENGEFHTFVTAGPMFDHAIAVTVGETVIREGFAYTDLLPV